MCGSHGTQARQVKCRQTNTTLHPGQGATATTTETTVALESCGEDMPPRQRPCNRRNCPARWQVGKWSSCSRPCGLGLRSRNVSCYRLFADGTDKQVGDRSCPTARPTAVETCNAIDCPPQETRGPWGECSRTCGPGTQTRTISCEMLNSHGEMIAVDEKRCPHPRAPPMQVYNRYRINCPSNCQPGPWTPCSRSCGLGTQSRDVFFERVLDDGTLETVVATPSHECALSAVRSCKALDCPSDWHFGAWGPCSEGRCGEQSRSVHCEHVTADGQLKIIPDVRCPQPKPSTQQQCIDPGCSTFNWAVGEWSPCSRSCGSGQQTRRVVCVNGFNVRVNDSMCTDPKPTTHEVCNAIDCPGEFRIDAWGDCSKSCGSGIQTRQVECVQLNSAGFFHLAENAYCDHMQRPSVERACNAIPCPPRWDTSNFSACGEDGATVTRSVECKRIDASGRELLLPESVCYRDVGAKPAEQQICSPLCGRTQGEYDWFAADWSSSVSSLTFCI